MIEELIANSFMRVQWENQGKLLLPVRPVATTKIKREIPRTRKGRDPEALAALRAPRARSPQSLKGSGTSSSKPSPAAVCLVASMLASVSQAFCIPQPRVVCPSIRFDDSPDVSLVKAPGGT